MEKIDKPNKWINSISAYYPLSSSCTAKRKKKKI